MGPIKVEQASLDRRKRSISLHQKLLAKCQREFEKNKEEAIEDLQESVDKARTDDEKKQLKEELDKTKSQMRRCYLGNIKFIGELFRLKMLSETIMHGCLTRLLKSGSDEDSLECFAVLITTIGKDLEKPETENRMDSYFKRVNDIIKRNRISSRIKFKLKDVQDLRANNWEPCPNPVQNQLKTIDQEPQYWDDGDYEDSVGSYEDSVGSYEDSDGSEDSYGNHEDDSYDMNSFFYGENCGLFPTQEKPPSSNGASTQGYTLQLGRELAAKTQETHYLQQQLSSTERKLQKQMATLQGEMRVKTETVARLQGEMREKTETVARLQGEVREKTETVARLQGEVREKTETVARLQGEVREKTGTLARRDQEIRLQREHHATELRRLREESENHQHQLREEQVQHQHLLDRIDSAVANLRGEAVSPQALELWELPREEIHISQTILGTGGWGYVARGTFQGQRVAVKCLHRGILSAQNAARMQREISLMAQVRHPNLLLLIGAVLTTEGEGPLIVTELLDRSLRSAYEEGVLEERSKVPVLRDVASALTYLHSHRTPIIHRDVSSANILLETVRLDCQWKAKLSDFGSANLSHLASTPAEGAAVYAAPEVSTEDRSRQTAKIDVYSFGVLVCEVCLCRFPPDRQQFPSMLVDVLGTAPHMFPLSRDCTSHTHQDRPTMRQVLERLDQLNN